MLYRYVVGVRYVICNIIIDVSYELFMDGIEGSREMDVRDQGDWTLGERKLKCSEAEYFKRFV